MVSILQKKNKMADQGIWFKLWDGWEYDPDIANLSKEDKLHWVLLGCYLKKHGNSGMTCLMKPAQALQKKLDLPTYEALLLVLKKLPGYVIGEKQNGDVANATIPSVALTIECKNWHKYQQDYSSIRSRIWREKKRMMQRFKKRGEEKRRDEMRKEESIPPKSPTSFLAPKPEEVTAYAKSLGVFLDGQKFVAYYEASGWMRGKTKIKDWRACVRTWKPTLPPLPVAVVSPSVKFSHPELSEDEREGALQAIAEAKEILKTKKS